MTLNPEHRELLERLRQKHRIRFLDSALPAEWPSAHRHHFEEVLRAGNFSYDTYVVDHQNASANAPWKLEIKELSAQLAERAQRCRGQNESSWRFACEPLIFARLSAEIACKRCRKRNWRSEIEASRQTDSERRKAALKKRQDKRQSCRCSRLTRQVDSDERIGLNRIFTHREDEPILQPKLLAEELPKSGERPDRIYGLRQTRNFEDLLYSPLQNDPSGNNKLVQDIVNVSPISLDGEPLLFPFIVLEAKSGKAGDSWHSMKLQTAFPLHACLNSQYSLRTATGTESRWEAGPLVWYFMNKGEHWRLSAAYMQIDPDSSDGTEYCILDLWEGCILSRDGALQLLLIVDHIVDWARDTFRDDILTELQILAWNTEDSTSVIPDSEIFSSQETVISTITEPQASANSDEVDRIRSSFRLHDSPVGMVRHAAFVDSHFCMLLITRNNVETLLRSTKTTMTQFLTRRILAQISKRPFKLDIDTLYSIEEHWTGTERHPKLSGFLQTKFIAGITLATFMSPLWDQVRELCVIAIAQDAFDSLVQASKSTRKDGKVRLPYACSTNRDEFVQAICSLRNRAPDRTLLSAIERTHYRLSDDFAGNIHLVPDAGIFREIVQFLYRTFKPGILEPNMPFLHISSRYEQMQNGPEDEVTYPYQDTLKVSPEGAVLVYGGGRGEPEIPISKQSNICLYLTRGQPEAPDRATIARIIKDTFENYDVYHTTRDNGTSNVRISQQRPPWNLENSYGLFTSDDGFITWLQKLGSDLPSRQGSPRNRGSRGRFLSRNLFPFHDRRFIAWPGDYKAFISYKLTMADLDFWEEVAQEKKKSGTDCCRSCATEGDDLCVDCAKQVAHPTLPRWVSDKLAGKHPVRWCEVSPTNYAYRDFCWLDSIAAEYDDLPPFESWYKSISEYPDIDKPFTDILELQQQAKNYSAYRSDIRWGSSRRKRRRSSGSDS